MKHTIEIEGLPEGWEAVAYRIPLESDSYWNGHNVCSGKYHNGFASLIVQKTQPREITLVEITRDEYRKLFNDDNGIQIFYMAGSYWRIKEE